MQYKVGTISIDNGSVTVSGSDTKWLANIDSSYIFIVEGDDLFYEISSVDSDTRLTLLNSYNEINRTNVSYAIIKDYTYFFQWPTISYGDVEWPTIITETLRRIDRDLYQPSENKGSKYVVLEPQGSTPTETEGKLYYDSNENALMLYNGSEWIRLIGVPI